MARTLALLAYLACALPTPCTAQSPLLTLAGGTNLGNVGGVVYFDLQVLTTVTITQLDFYCGSLTPAGTGTLEVHLGPTTYVGNTLDPSLWTLIGSASQVPIAPFTMASGVLDAPLPLAPGDYGVLLRAVGFNHGYTNGNGSNQTFSNAELVLRAGAAQNAFLTGPLFSPRVFNGAIHYSLGGNPLAVSSWQPFGQGCYSSFRSFHQWFANPALEYDLGTSAGNTHSLSLYPTAGGYLVFPFNRAGSFFAPTAAATHLQLGNDSSATVTLPWPLPYPGPGGGATTTQLEVCSNGFVSPVPGNGSAAVPSLNAFLSGQPRWGNWYDFDPSQSGFVAYEVDPGGQAVYVTWFGVADRYQQVFTNTWQLVFARSGAVEFRWRDMAHSSGGGSPALVGWTPGGAAVDPGSIDLTSTPAFATGPVDSPPLELSLSARPRLASTPLLLTDHIPTGTAIGAVVLSLGGYDPGLPLTGLRMPGCSQYVDLGLAVPIAFAPSGGAASLPLAIPGSAGLVGTAVFGQAFTFTPGVNPLGVLASQGVRLSPGQL